MSIFKKISYTFFTTVAVLSFVNENKAEAGIVKIINKSDEKIKIHIVPALAETPYCWKCFESCVTANGRQSAALSVQVNAFSGKEYYSVMDVSNGFLGNSQCNNLSVLKNYEVSFLESRFGTYCEVKEI
jgi:hypothetical protein